MAKDEICCRQDQSSSRPLCRCAGNANVETVLMSAAVEGLPNKSPAQQDGDKLSSLMTRLLLTTSKALL